MNVLNVYYPLRFSDNIDARNIVTVGDQVVTEHLFAAHAVRNPKYGFKDMFSEVIINRLENIITIKPKYKISDSSGREISIENICQSIEQSFTETSHSKLKNIYESISCNSSKITIKMKQIPINMEALFSLPDFYIFDKKTSVASQNELNVSTGPYRLLSLTSDKVVLERNEFYPRSLVANTVKNVNIINNKIVSPKEFINSLGNTENILAYFPGDSFSTDDLDILESSDLVASINPTEWLLYFSYNSSDEIGTKGDFLSTIVATFRSKIKNINPFAQLAYSISPSDRSFGLNEFDLVIHENIPSVPSFRVGYLERDYNIPIVRELIEFIKLSAPKIQLVKYAVSDTKKLKEEEFALLFQGISAGDPIHHMAFFNKYRVNFKKLVNENEIEDLSKTTDITQFNNKVKNFELRISKSNMFIPIAHFPGIVIHSKNLKPDESLVGDWGIRAWTYQVLQ